MYIIEKKQNTTIILYNVNIDDIEKYYYYFSYLKYNVSIIIDSTNIEDNEVSIIEKYENIIIQKDLFSYHLNKFDEILTRNPIDYKINKSNMSNFSIGNQVDTNYGKHRFGWNYVKQSIKNVEKSGIFLDIFLEKKFIWDFDNCKPYEKISPLSIKTSKLL